MYTLTFYKHLIMYVLPCIGSRRSVTYDSFRFHIQVLEAAPSMSSLNNIQHTGAVSTQAEAAIF